MTHPTSPSSTFVVRFWYETSAGERRWRGQIEHVQSGRRIHFLSVDGLLRFLHQFGIGTDSQPEHETECKV
jgi:hypothetical protein